MIAIEENVAMMMSGEMGPTAFADIRSIGALNAKINKTFSKQLCGILNEQCGIPADRVSMNYTDIEASYWGWNDSTFG